MNSVLYRILEWITKMALVNVLWIFFSLIGAIIIGIFPSTTAMYAIIRKWLRRDTDIPVLRTFWVYYKKEFRKSNILGAILLPGILLICLDIWYIQASRLDWIQVPLFAFILLYIIFLFYIFPTYVHYDLHVFKIIKQAFLIMLIHPLHTFLMILCLTILFFIYQTLPALAFIFGGSIYALITMWLGLHAFQLIHKKQETHK
ncbi:MULTISPECIES: YesL family protein [Virgibacillus]|uniref:YesL family protein n=1 Tax=Virgibacillus TaxID=84406 RepID=UPI00038851A6|nr:MULTISPECIES: DUF624 domain-containing protein [Virgibacillus]EQB37983.1 hypothetical protein M948_05285 [Virgibacillus sp. CM-4]